MKKYAQKNIKAISSFMHFCCRTPPGVRGLKLSINHIFATSDLRRTPPGVRGLKLDIVNMLMAFAHVAPHPGCVD